MFDLLDANGLPPTKLRLLPAPLAFVILWVWSKPLAGQFCCWGDVQGGLPNSFIASRQTDQIASPQAYTRLDLSWQICQQTHKPA